MRKFYLILIAALVFLVASAEIFTEVPQALVFVLTLIILPGFVELVSAAVNNWGWKWAQNKTVISVVLLGLSIVTVFIYTAIAGMLPAIPQDPLEAVKAITVYASALVGAATLVYNFALRFVLDWLAKKGITLLDYRLEVNAGAKR